MLARAEYVPRESTLPGESTCKPWLYSAVQPTSNSPEPDGLYPLADTQPATPPQQVAAVGYGLPGAPPVALSPEPGATPMDGPLRLVITLMFGNLGLSVVLTALMLIFRDSIVDYQLAYLHLPADVDPAKLATVRLSLRSAMWGRLGSVLVVSVFYVWRAYALRRGSRRAYLRLIWLCVIGLGGIAYLIAFGNYPMWMRFEQVLQAIVLVSLLWAVTRRQVRDRFAKRPVA